MKKLLALLLLATAPLAGQITKTANAAASVTIATSLVLSNTVGASFGSFAATAGTVDLATPAQWTGNCDANCTLSSIAFTLPATLANGAATVPMTYGTTSATVTPAGKNATIFNPSLGTTNVLTGPTGNFTLLLGAGNTNTVSDSVRVNLTGAAAGTYSGTIVATVVR